MIIISKVPLKRCVYDWALQRYQSIFSVVRQKEQPSFSQFSDHCILKSHKFRELKQTKNLCPPSDMKKRTRVALIFANLLSCVHAINPCCYAVKLWVTDISYFCIYMNWPEFPQEKGCLGKWESASLQMQKSANAQMQLQRLDENNPSRHGKQSGTWLFDWKISPK